MNEVENLLLRLSKVSSDMTNSINSNFGSITKKQIKEQEVVVKKLSKYLNINQKKLLDRLND